jgi:hypothetical protein
MIIRKIRNNNSLVVPQGRYFINRRLQPTDRPINTLPRSPAGTILNRNLTPGLIPKCRPYGTLGYKGCLIRRLKPTVNKVLSLRDCKKMGNFSNINLKNLHYGKI